MYRNLNARRRRVTIGDRVLDGRLLPVTVIRCSAGFEAYVDADDFERVRDYSWTSEINSNTVYAFCKELDGIKLHRYLLNPPKDKIVHHRNHNGLDNRRDNIVITTQSINMLYQKDPDKGISFDASRNRWKVRLTVNYQEIFLGRTRTIEAARALLAKGRAQYVESI